MTRTVRIPGLAHVICLLILAGGCGAPPEVVDDARKSGKTAADFPVHAGDLFAAMDGGIPLGPHEIQGRNTWMLWTAGNEAFWDHAATYALGVVDLLKLCDNRFLPRSDRLARTGLINEPGMRAPDGPGAHGLWIDLPVEEGIGQPDPAVYGRSTGIVGLRLFPNPDFDAAAQRRWDAVRYLADERYGKQSDLVRPYRVGMACSFCHVAFHPLRPPADPSEPEWGNLSALIGNQYWKSSRIIAADRAPQDLAWQVMNSAAPGTIDTSIAATDGINNPTAINPIWEVGARLEAARKSPPEIVSAAVAVTPTLTDLGFPDGRERYAPKVLMTGADSVGAIGALARVWVNIGSFHQQWTRSFNLFVGITPQTPFRVADARRNSVYYQVSEAASVNVAMYLARASVPMRLEDASWTDDSGQRRSGRDFIDDGRARLGSLVFAQNCFVCHSSKQPDRFWEDPSNYDRWRSDEEYLRWASAEAVKPDFRDGNYFSTDARHPVTLVGTNAARALSDNAIAGHVWAEYSSETYKALPQVGRILVQHPYTGEDLPWTPREGLGPGYYRPFSLVGVWATAPFMHTNRLGRYPSGSDPGRGEAPDLSVPGRLAVFEDAAERLLWPERREGIGSIARTTSDSRLRVPYGLLPAVLDSQLGFRPPFLFRGTPWVVPLALAGGGALIYHRLRKRRWRFVAAPFWLAAVMVYWVDHSLYVRGALELGTIPAGTPVSLVANLNGPGTLGDADQQRWMRAALRDLITVDRERLASLDHPRVPDLVANLLRANKVPDFVEDRGHLFGAHLSDEDKRALIEFLKTL